MTDSPPSVIERFFPAMFAADSAALAELLHPDVVWHVPPFVADEFGLVEGCEAVLGFLCSAGDEFYQPGSFSLDVEVQAVEKDRAVIVGQMRAITSRGAPYINRYAFAFRFTDGRIREAYELLDSLSFQRQQEKGG